jgi:hypothetical protein
MEVRMLASPGQILPGAGDAYVADLLAAIDEAAGSQSGSGFVQVGVLGEKPVPMVDPHLAAAKQVFIGRRSIVLNQALPHYPVEFRQIHISERAIASDDPSGVRSVGRRSHHDFRRAAPIIEEIDSLVNPW